MTKENLLFSIIGVLMGFIGGFMVANSASQRMPVQRPPATAPASQAAEPPAAPAALPAEEDATQGADSQELEDALQKAKSDAGNFDAQVSAARLFYEQRQYDQAIELFKRANELRPDDYETITALGNAYFDAGRYVQAGDWYARALNKKPGDLNVRTDLGLTFFFRQPRDMERAIKEFRTSLKQDPAHEQTLINLIVVLSEKGDVKEAQNMLAQLEKAHPDSSALPKLRERLAELAKTKG